MFYMSICHTYKAINVHNTGVQMYTITVRSVNRFPMYAICSNI